ncbi:MAG: WD40 repeat domain-containing protein [Planctomycetota bacterium]
MNREQSGDESLASAHIRWSEISVRRLGLTRERALHPLALHPNGKAMVVSRGWGSELMLCDVTTGDTLQRSPFPHLSNFPYKVSPDGRTLVQTDYGRPHICRLGSGEKWTGEHSHPGPIFALDVSPSGRYLVTGADDEHTYEEPTPPAATLVFWEICSGRCVWIQDAGWVITCVFSPDGRHILCASNHTAFCEGRLQLREAGTGEPIPSFSPPPHCMVDDVAYSPDGLHFAIVTRDCKLVVCGAATGDVVLSRPIPSIRCLWPHGFHCHFTLSGEEIAVSAAREVIVYRFKDGKRMAGVSLPALVREFWISSPHGLIAHGEGRVFMLKSGGLSAAPPIVSATRLWNVAADAAERACSVRCPHCGVRENVSEKNLGSAIFCQNCRKPLRLNEFLAVGHKHPKTPACGPGL